MNVRYVCALAMRGRVLRGLGDDDGHGDTDGSSRLPADLGVRVFSVKLSMSPSLSLSAPQPPPSPLRRAVGDCAPAWWDGDLLAMSTGAASRFPVLVRTAGHAAALPSKLASMVSDCGVDVVLWLPLL